jgi:lactoylglutathione lyase
MTIIDHVALYTTDLDAAADFWRRCFSAEIGEPYHSQRRPGFTSRFATLPDGPRIELMSAPWIERQTDAERQGWDHIALSLGSRAAVDQFVQDAGRLGHPVSTPRMTGDGYYEAVVRAPDGTRVEITA